MNDRIKNRQDRPKYLFLYEEPAAYTFSCLNAFAEKYDCEIHLVKKALNPDAPFDFSSGFNGISYNQEDWKSRLDDLYQRLQPVAVFCGGWLTKEYIRLCVRLNKSVPVVLALDTPWRGTIKQWVAVVAWNIYYRKSFSACFLPGQRQYEYARKLGFSSREIHKGVYSADVKKFGEYFQDTLPVKQEKYPRRFLYAGRYAPEKGIELLWSAFEKSGAVKRGWELWCIGTGPIKAVEQEGVRHFGFVQPGEMEPLIRDCGVFILPSLFEPWGVVVHEMAAAGMPLLLSQYVGAREHFLEEGRNGFSFDSGNENAICKALLKMMELPEESLKAMSAHSYALAQRNTPEIWADRFWSMTHS